MSLGKQLIILIALLGTSSALGALLWTLILCFYLVATEGTVLSIQVNDLRAVAYVWFVSGVVVVPAALVCGTPTFFLLRKYCLLRWWVICPLGAIVGAVIGTTDISFGVPWSAGLGLISACIAWVLIVRSNLPLNPDAPPIGGAPVS